jgi:hypothetical protein
MQSRGFRRPSPSLSAGSGYSASTVAGSIGGGVDGTGQRQMLSDRYALGEELGRGAFGQVFKGMDTRSGEAVAIKQMCDLLIIPDRAIAYLRPHACHPPELVSAAYRILVRFSLNRWSYALTPLP